MNFKHLVIALAGCACIGSAQAAFTGSSAPGNWTLGNTNGGNGSASNDGSTLTLSSANFADFDAAPLDGSTTSYGISFAHAGTVSFDWSYLTADEGGSSYDRFGYVLDGTAYQLSSDGLWDAQSGHASFAVAAGSHFAFTMNSDAIWGGAVATVSNFSAISAVPEADPLAMLALGLPLAVLAARRRRAA
ncbi:hypothetical protein [Derxia lacustris]|uniref:hypothetical protein n=1 Tax=Derxia lacustris TaxID=764842 RepID=UPI000A172BC7|nr:hypothetical protein [Derxia lacustris]